MNWLIWLGLAVLIGVVAAVTGMKPRGTRPVAGTRLMGVGRVILFLIVALFLYMAYRARLGS
jgi:hypothetical protein